MTSRPNIHQQIEEVQRELRMRGTVYAGLVGRGKMRQSEADEQTLRLTAVLNTLLWCRDHREALAAVEDAAKPNAEIAELIASAQIVYDKLADPTGSVSVLEQTLLGKALAAIARPVPL